MHFKLNVLEKYTILHLYLLRVLLEDAPILLHENEFGPVAECISVLREVRRVARLLEADKRVAGSRVPRLMKELNDTLLIMASHRSSREATIRRVKTARRSTSKDDEKLLEARSRLIHD